MEQADNVWTPTPVLWWRGTGQPQYALDLIREKGIIYQQNKEKQENEKHHNLAIRS